jgi:aldehyde:ferredoxin oxidoreductase
MLEVGERIWNMERQFNLDAGITGDQDKLPDRLLKEAAQTGPAKGLVNKLDEMLPEYYQLRGWTAQGTLKPETRERFGI